MKHHESVHELTKGEELFARTLEGVPYVDDLGLPVEEGMRRAAAGLTLGGLKVSRFSENGEEGSAAYPYFEIEPIIEKREFDFYQRALKRRNDFDAGILSDREHAVIAEMEARRALFDELVHALVDQFYEGRSTDSIEGIERLVATQNGNGAVIIVPAGAKTMREKNGSDEEERERRDRERLFAGEIQKFADFLIARFAK